MVDQFKVVLDDAIWTLPDDFYCDDCKPKVTTPGFKMCDTCGNKPAPEHLVRNLKNYLSQIIKLEENRRKPYG